MNNGFNNKMNKALKQIAVLFALIAIVAIVRLATLNKEINKRFATDKQTEWVNAQIELNHENKQINVVEDGGK